MARAKLFNLGITHVEMDVPGQLLGQQVVRSAARLAAEDARRLLTERTEQGNLLGDPSGTSGLVRKHYSTHGAMIPLVRTGEDSPTRRARYDALAARVRQQAQGENVTVSREGIPWIYVPGGYAQFRRAAGLNAEMITLSFTGRMLEDLRIMPRIEAANPPRTLRLKRSFRVAGKFPRSVLMKDAQRAQDRRLGGWQISLRIGFATQSSWRIAYWQGRRYGNYFAAFTPEEEREVGRLLSEYLSRARERFGGPSRVFAPRGEHGHFIPFDLF